jgi:hypothetical protein
MVQVYFYGHLDKDSCVTGDLTSLTNELFYKS